ncbi:hypothetical protein D9619_000198 [Psilocybe cf. subviscida]|uniref:Ubiquitin-like protease family profile domain-containing protein n=1 Tax=Psilocybe cf. subviscida TaxID=2480587 RepID=A0A8H5BE97_9AGAR|nr:hypothetical protein D9619_000198 [Psilocybe cf. subviscida]
MAGSMPDNSLPPKTLDVLRFLKISFPQPIRASLPRFTRIEKYYSTDPPNSTDLVHAHQFPLPPEDVVDGLWKALHMGSQSKKIQSIICQHEPSAGGQLFPLDLASYWKECLGQLAIQEKWMEAVEAILPRLPWTGRLNGFANTINIDQLLLFLTREWLTDDHELILLDILKEDLACANHSKVFVENTAFMVLLGTAYANDEEYATSSHYQWMREYGEALVSGKKRYLATIMNHRNVHWTALLIDFSLETIQFGDLKKQPMPANHKSVIEWWIKQHTPTRFTHETMPIARQTDNYSCGMLAWYALRNRLLPLQMVTVPAAMVGRAEMFVLIATRHLEQTVGGDEHATPAEENDPDNTEEWQDTQSNFSASTPNANCENDPSSNSDSSNSENNFFHPKGSRKRVQDFGITAATTKCQCVTLKSSIRTTLEAKGSATGILQFFRQATTEERQQYLDRTADEVRDYAETHHMQAELAKQKKESRERQQARERKRLQRARMRDIETKTGIRSPGGRKHQTRDVVLAHPPKLNQGGTVAELSRPANKLKKIWKEETRKPQGRKAFRASEVIKYHNWFEPFLFRQIEAARIRSGGPRWSASAIVKDLQARDFSTFVSLARTTMNEWVDRSGDIPQWTDATKQKIERGVLVSNPNAGQKGILINHPEVVDRAKKIIVSIRATGAIVSVITARGVLLAVVIKQAPDILTKTFTDGSTFRASDSFVRKWLHNALGYSQRQGTQAAQKLPIDWEDQCEKAIIRHAYQIKEEDIVSELIVNSDQTQVLYAPGNKLTWAERGLKQVQVLGGEEKRAFTVMISVSSDGKLLPLQAIYSGKSRRSRPSPNSPCHKELLDAGCLIQESGTSTYWSNIATMKDFVNGILSPYFELQKTSLGLPPSQKSLWIIDFWSVHRSKEFRQWMKDMYPGIIVDYVPGGCTSVAQPCDVGIQRPFKHSVKRSYHEDVVANIMEQLDLQADTVTIDTRLGVLRNASTRWLWNAYQTVNDKALMQKSFERCVARGWNLSYTSMTGVAMRACLQELKTTNPGFWAELTSADFDAQLPPKDILQPEDGFVEDAGDIDDSDIPTHVIRQEILGLRKTGSDTAYEPAENGGMVAHKVTMAESFEDVGQEAVVSRTDSNEHQLGRGKRRIRCPTRYAQFWKHDDNAPSDEEDYNST